MMLTSDFIQIILANLLKYVGIILFDKLVKPYSFKSILRNNGNLSDIFSNNPSSLYYKKYEATRPKIIIMKLKLVNE